MLIEPLCARFRVFPDFKGCCHIACRQCWRLTYCPFCDSFICQAILESIIKYWWELKNCIKNAAFVRRYICKTKNHSAKYLFECMEHHEVQIPRSNVEICQIFHMTLFGDQNKSEHFYIEDYSTAVKDVLPSGDHRRYFNTLKCTHLY